MQEKEREWEWETGSRVAGVQTTNAGVLRCVWEVLGVRVSEVHGIHAPTPPMWMEGAPPGHQGTHWPTWHFQRHSRRSTGDDH